MASVAWLPYSITLWPRKYPTFIVDVSMSGLMVPPITAPSAHGEPPAGSLFTKGILTMTTDRNALGDAYTTVAEVAELLDHWSQRPAATVSADQRTETSARGNERNGAVFAPSRFSMRRSWIV